MKKEEKRKDLWREIVDIGTAHADEPPQALDFGGHIGRVHAHLHHLRLPPLSSSWVVGAAVLLASCARRALSSLLLFALLAANNQTGGLFGREGFIDKLSGVVLMALWHFFFPRHAR